MTAALILGLVLLIASARPAPCQESRSDAARPAMEGRSNGGRSPHEPYVTAGDRTYLSGTQDGTFPDQGGHVPGEMGGLWMHPIKLIDGFAATLTDTESGRDSALTASREFVAYPYGSRF